MRKYRIIVNVNLEYEVNAESEQEAEDQLLDVELPKEYVEDSFEIVKIIDEGDVR